MSASELAVAQASLSYTLYIVLINDSYLRDPGYEQSPGWPNDRSEEQCSGDPVRI